MARIYRFLGKFGSSGSGEGEFNTLRKITCDEDYIYVCDNGNNRVQVFDRASPYDFVGEFGSAGTGNGQFNNLSDIHVDDNYIYTMEADGTNERMQIFSKLWPYSYQAKFSLPASQSGPYEFCIDSSYFYVSADNGSNFAIFQYAITYPYTLVGIYTSAASGAISINASHLFGYAANNLKKYELPTLTQVQTSNIGSQSVRDTRPDANYLYVTFNNSIRVYDISTLAFVGYFGDSGSGDGQFASTPYFEVYDDKFYVADTGNNRIQVFDFTDLTTPDTPTNFALQCASGDRIRLSWE